MKEGEGDEEEGGIYKERGPGDWGLAGQKFEGGIFDLDSGFDDRLTKSE
jgi:hypothetical protein